MEEKKNIYQKHLEWATQDDSPLEGLEEPLHTFIKDLELKPGDIDLIGALFVTRMFDASLMGYKAGYAEALREIANSVK